MHSIDGSERFASKTLKEETGSELMILRNGVEGEALTVPRRVQNTFLEPSATDSGRLGWVPDGNQGGELWLKVRNREQLKT